MIYGRKHLAERGAEPLAGIAVAAGAALGIVFVRRQRALVDPLIDLRLFRRPAFSAAVALSASSAPCSCSRSRS